MSYRQMEVLGRVERRRRFSLEQKVAVLAEACAPGAVISEVARRHGLLPSQVFKWRRLAALGVIGIPGTSELPSFVAVEVAAEPPTTASEPVGEGSAKRATLARTSSAEHRERPAGVIEIDLGADRCVRVVGDVDAKALRRVLDVLDGR